VSQSRKLRRTGNPVFLSWWFGSNDCIVCLLAASVKFLTAEFGIGMSIYIWPRTKIIPISSEPSQVICPVPEVEF
jgi:hypothetical protein